MKSNFQKIANKVSFVTITQNIILSVAKLVVGIMAHSNAMISDAIHSASDVFSTIVVMIGIKLASKEPDKEHPYGHERLECVTAIILAIILFVTGLGIGITAITNILASGYVQLSTPGMLAMIAAIVSILFKEGMFSRSISSGSVNRSYRR